MAHPTRFERVTFAFFSAHVVSELEASQREPAEPGADLADVDDALTVLARRFEREEVSDFDARLLRSAARDAGALVSE